MNPRTTAIALALVLSLTLVHYVRRAWLPRAATIVTVVGGSRDRSLRGKARVRARRLARGDA